MDAGNLAAIAPRLPPRCSLKELGQEILQLGGPFLGLLVVMIHANQRQTLGQQMPLAHRL